MVFGEDNNISYAGTFKVDYILYNNNIHHIYVNDYDVIIIYTCSSNKLVRGNSCTVR